MNERIKLFAERAGMKSPDGFKLTVSHMATFQLEKFAELIVKDIILKIDQEIDLAYEQEEAWTASTLQALSLEILEHFDMELPDDA